MTTDNDTTTYEAETGPDGSPRAHWTAIGGTGRDTVWWRHTWPVEAARAGLVDAWLAVHPDDRRGVVIVDDAGDPIGQLIRPDVVEQLQACEREIAKLKEQPADGALHPAVHGPGAGGDALLVDTEEIRDDLAMLLARRELFDSRPQDLPGGAPEWDAWRAQVRARADVIRTDERGGLILSSIDLAYSMAPQPDEHGILPIRAWHAREEGAEQVASWQLAYTTPVRGLFVRAGRPNIFGEEFDVVSGSGYMLRGGFISREIAEGFARAIADAAPGIDWRCWTTTAEDMTPAIRDALTAVTRKWGSWGPREEPAERPATAAAAGQPTA